jgi:hypothetical protein
MPTVLAPPPRAGDCTALLEDFINAQGFGTTITFPQTARYVCEQNVRIREKVGLVVQVIPLRRYGHHKRKPSGAEDNVRVEHLTLQSCLGVRIVGANIIGPKRPETGYTDAQEGQAAIGLHGCARCSVESSGLQHVHGDFIYLGSRGGTPCRDITLTDNRGFDAGRHGICVTALHGALIRGNTMRDFHRDGYHTERSRKGDGWSGIVRSGNTFEKAKKG